MIKTDFLLDRMNQDSADKPVPRPTSRKPCQARGQQRVEAILEAAGSLIAAESSISALTMHKLAEAAQTSIGSLYHFFPDKDCVIAALEEKHSRAFNQIVGDLALVHDAEWLPLSAQEVIDRVFEPFFRYADAHPEIFQLDCGRNQKDEPTLRNLFDKILKLRKPGISARQRLLYAHMLESIIIGTSQNFNRAIGISKTEWTREVTVAQAAYLRSIEERHTTETPGKPRSKS